MTCGDGNGNTATAMAKVMAVFAKAAVAGSKATAEGNG